MAAFLKYEGVDGESKDANHHAWIDVLSMDWGVQSPGGRAAGASRRRGGAVVEDMDIVFDYEKAAPKLLEKCLTGEVIPKVEIELTATYGGARATYLRYELKNVLITSYQTSASGDDEAGPPTVVLANNFEAIKVTYTEYDEGGSSLGNVETSYRRRGAKSSKRKKSRTK